MELNVAELKKIKGQILAAPGAFGMERYAIVNECGTTLCIAGWALLNHGHTAVEIARMKPDEAGQLATEILGLYDDVAFDLFNHSYWPYRFRRDYYAATTPEGRATAGAQMIDFVLENKGAYWSSGGSADEDEE